MIQRGRYPRRPPIRQRPPELPLLERVLQILRQHDVQVQIEIILARLRFLIALAMIDMTALMTGSIFELESPLMVAERIQGWAFLNFLWSRIPAELLTIIVPIFDRGYFKYLFPPIGAILLILIAGSFYLMDIYQLRSFRTAIQYVFASMFGFFYPKIEIDGGRLILGEDMQHVLNEIGGPGYVLIQPGSAAIFRYLHRPSITSTVRSYFLLPFEQIGYFCSLDDQHGFVERTGSVSRDGIRVSVRNIHFRYRIMTRNDNGIAVPRTLQEPYPFDEEAMLKMEHNLTVDETGLTDWERSVQRAITGGITGFITTHNIDYLTAPAYRGNENAKQMRSPTPDPRVDLRRELFGPVVTKRLASIGTELLWVDIGHIDISEDVVDQQRLDLWSVDWVGNVNRARAIGDATRIAFHELGRAESNAMMISAIAEALSQVPLDGDHKSNLRRLLLARTAQVLEDWNNRVNQRQL